MAIFGGGDREPEAAGAGLWWRTVSSAKAPPIGSSSAIAAARGSMAWVVEGSSLWGVEARMVAVERRSVGAMIAARSCRVLIGASKR